MKISMKSIICELDHGKYFASRIARKKQKDNGFMMQLAQEVAVSPKIHPFQLV